MDKITKMHKNLVEVDKFLKTNNYLNKCLVNCSDCCYDYFYASYLEFYLTLNYICKLPYDLDYFYHKALKSYQYFKKYLPTELKRLDPLVSNTLITSVVADSESGEYINYKGLPACIMLNNGLCSVYFSRPNTCRKYGTTICCEYLNNLDYRDDEYTNYNLYPLIENTLLISKNKTTIKMPKYPLWFYYSYFLRPNLRPFILNNLKLLTTLSEEDFFDYLTN